MADTTLELAAALSALEPPVFMFGGVAEDAVLDGALTRPHSDVDVLLPRHELDLRLQQFAALGYTNWETWLSDSTGRAQVLHSADHAAELEVSIFDGEAGAYWFELENPRGGHFHFHAPPDIFGHGPVSLDGLAVRTVTPHALYMIRAALIKAGSFGEPRPNDLAVQPRLRALLDGVDEAALEPRLDSVP